MVHRDRVSGTPGCGASHTWGQSHVASAEPCEVVGDLGGAISTTGRTSVLRTSRPEVALEVVRCEEAEHPAQRPRGFPGEHGRLSVAAPVGLSTSSFWSGASGKEAGGRRAESDCGGSQSGGGSPNRKHRPNTQQSSAGADSGSGAQERNLRRLWISITEASPLSWELTHHQGLGVEVPRGPQCCLFTPDGGGGGQGKR